jgi:hypothetical protein
VSAPRGHEISQHAAFLKLVLDGVHMVRTSLLEESLEVVYQWSRLVLETTFSSHDILLVGVIRFLVVVVIVAPSCNCKPPRAPLSPLLASLGTLLDTMDDSTK